MTMRMDSLFLAIRPPSCEPGGQEAADPIYRELTLRTLANHAHGPVPQIPAAWLAPDGRPHKDVLLRALLDFWRLHGKSLRTVGGGRSRALTPYLALSTFLQRVVDRGSRMRERTPEYGPMNRSMRHQGETLAIEVGVWRPQKADPLRDGLKQIDGYLAGLGLNAGWLAISDCRLDAPVLPERRCAALATTHDGQEVTWISRMSCAWTAPQRPHERS